MIELGNFLLLKMKLFMTILAYSALCAHCSTIPSIAPAESTPLTLGPAYPIALKITDMLRGKYRGKDFSLDEE